MTERCSEVEHAARDICVAVTGFEPREVICTRVRGTVFMTVSLGFRVEPRALHELHVSAYWIAQAAHPEKLERSLAA